MEEGSSGNINASEMPTAVDFDEENPPAGQFVMGSLGTQESISSKVV